MDHDLLATSVFLVLTLVIISPVYAVLPDDVVHVGCFKTKLVEAQPSYYKIPESLSWEQGVTACIQRYTTHVGVQADNRTPDLSKFFCGNDLLDGSTPMSELDCPRCKAKTERNCGGPETMSIYKIRGVKKDKSSTNTTGTTSTTKVVTFNRSSKLPDDIAPTAAVIERSDFSKDSNRSRTKVVPHQVASSTVNEPTNEDFTQGTAAVITSGRSMESPGKVPYSVVNEINHKDFESTTTKLAFREALSVHINSEESKESPEKVPYPTVNEITNETVASTNKVDFTEAPAAAINSKTTTELSSKISHSTSKYLNNRTTTTEFTKNNSTEIIYDTTSTVNTPVIPPSSAFPLNWNFVQILCIFLYFLTLLLLLATVLTSMFYILKPSSSGELKSQDDILNNLPDPNRLRPFTYSPHPRNNSRYM